MNMCAFSGLTYERICRFSPNFVMEKKNHTVAGHQDDSGFPYNFLRYVATTWWKRELMCWERNYCHVGLSLDSDLIITTEIYKICYF